MVNKNDKKPVITNITIIPRVREYCESKGITMPQFNLLWVSGAQNTMINQTRNPSWDSGKRLWNNKPGASYSMVTAAYVAHILDAEISDLFEIKIG